MTTIFWEEEGLFEGVGWGWLVVGYVTSPLRFVAPVVGAVYILRRTR